MSEIHNILIKLGVANRHIYPVKNPQKMRRNKIDIIKGTGLKS